MKHNIMVQATALRNVAGRVDYISNPDRQEHLVATYSTVDDSRFWRDLSKHCQEQAKHSSGKNKRACEGREFMVPLANDLSKMDPAELCQLLSAKMKKLTGTENETALHWNKTMTNFHVHFVIAENIALAEAKTSAPMTRNTYFDAEGKRSTKKACIDADGELLPGCTLIKKGECKTEQILFGSKVRKIGRKSFLQEVKQQMVDYQNELLQEDRFRTFDRTLYIAQQHVGKGRPAEQAEAVKKKNQLAREYNEAVDSVLQVASELGDDALEVMNKELLKGRSVVKNHALTDKWPYAIQVILENFRKQIEALRKWQEKRSSKIDNRLTDARERRNPDRARNSRDEWQR